MYMGHLPSQTFVDLLLLDLTLSPDAVWSALLDWTDESHPRQRGLTALQTAYNTWRSDNGDLKKTSSCVW